MNKTRPPKPVKKRRNLLKSCDLSKGRKTKERFPHARSVFDFNFTDEYVRRMTVIYHKKRRDDFLEVEDYAKALIESEALAAIEKHQPVSEKHISPFFRAYDPKCLSGHTLTGDGYVMVDAPWHHRADAYGRVRLHVLVVEAEIGRYLEGFPNEVVHHIDGNKLNNHYENLQVLSNAEHLALHRDLRRMAKQSAA